MEATGTGALLRPIPVGIRWPTGDVGLFPARVKIGDGFNDEGHLRYYASARCGLKEEKRRMKLVKGLEKDLSALYSMGLGVDKGEGMAGEDKGQIISEAAELLLAQLTKLQAEAKEMKRRRKQEKAAKKKAAKMKDRMDSESSSSSSSESSDSECETAAKMSSLRTASDPMTEAALQTEDVAAEAKNNLLQTEDVAAEAKNNLSVNLEPHDNRIEVCMGGKCKKSGAMELMAEFEKKVGIEGAVVGCKCMGKCRDGPNVRVAKRSSVEDRLARAAKGPMCVGVGLEDVGSIVAEFLGESKRGGVGLLVA